MKQFLGTSLLFLFCAASALHGQTFADFLVQVNIVGVEKRQALVDSFMQTVSSFPFTEDSLAHFIYRGTGHSLAVPGDFSGWNPDNAPMNNLGGTDFWHRTEIFDRDARLEYKFVRNSTDWFLDPCNSFHALGGIGSNSELRMPSYIPPVEIQFFENIPHGSLVDTTFASVNLGNSRRIKIYLPPGYGESDARYPVVLMHDGLEYINFAMMNNVVDFLISKNKIEPVIVVFVPPVDRNPEYIDAKQATFTKFIIEEMVPWVDNRFRTQTEPAKRVVAGSSASGNIALWIGLNHPEVFGNVGAFSSFIESEIQSRFASQPKLNLRIYMNHGKYDHAPVIHQSVNDFIPTLKAKGYDFEFALYPEGHNYGFWRAHLDDMLIFFFPGQVTSTRTGRVPPEKFNLKRNYPNPFNPSTTIEFEVPLKGHTTLTVFNLLGRQVATLADNVLASGTHKRIFDGTALASGIYIYSLRAGEFMDSKKLILLK